MLGNWKGVIKIGNKKSFKGNNVGRVQNVYVVKEKGGILGVEGGVYFWMR